MDLWIRSQDKKRLVHAYGGEVVEALDGWKIREYATNDYVGKYKTEKRAIEILDEIQKLLVPCYIVDKDYNSGLDMFVPNKDSEIKVLPRECVVYQMPADDEVK